MADQFEIEILEDGTVSVTTEDISQTNHYSAEEFMAELEKALGGPVVRTKREGRKAKAHRHGKKHLHVH